ncbi:MAG: TVP38/TMEM64 family protein [Parvibaculum sp.]|nr:TVP38/TMEM64 family protein [Parvibaculum sp.]MBO6692510.1 TVP38/TMEM64 family protein [Parvibaculum sp.]MBO6713248.1 TVP38/TMEM64 family protein [Parvibaculum sp.]
MLRRFLPLLVLAAGLGAFFALGLDRYVTLDTLRDNRQALSAWVAENWALAAFVYVLAYIVMVAFSLPGALVATLTGGFLFGTVFGGLLTVLGATIGATVIFLAAKTALGDMLREKAGPRLRKLEEGFGRNAFSYMLVLRLVPIFPFFLVNLAPAFLGVSLGTYVLSTFLGIIPGTFVFASLGNGLGAVFDAGRDPDLGLIFEPEILGPILALAALALVPVIYRRFTGTGAAE